MKDIKKKPILRFPNYSSEWEFVQLNQIFPEIVVGFVGTVSDSYCDKEKGVLFIRTLNVRDGYFTLENVQFVTPEFHNSNKKSKIYNDDILIARVGANMGQVCKVSGLTAEANSANVIIIKKHKGNSSIFYALYLSSEFGQKQINARGAGGAQEVMNISVTKTILVPQLSLQEQEKVASFLNAIDKKLEGLKEKKKLLEEYKKGVMQKIFSQELRFRDEEGRDFPDWEEKKLGEIAEIVGGGTPETNKEEYWNGDIQWFTPTEIKFDFVSKSLRTITELGLKKSSAKILPIGSILLTTRATIGEAAIALQECATNQGFQSLIVKAENNNIFVFNWIKVNKYELTSRANGSTFPEISKSELEKISIPIPFLDEQIKIANFLSAIDNKINQTQTMIEQTEQYKKGLLQRMFC